MAVSQPSVGGPLNVVRITDEDGTQELDDEEIAELRDGVRRWEQAEQERLDTLLGGDEP